MVESWLRTRQLDGRTLIYMKITSNPRAITLKVPAAYGKYLAEKQLAPTHIFKGWKEIHNELYVHCLHLFPLASLS